MKTLLVTGATRGIGMAAVRMLTAEGYAVIGIYNTNEEQAKQLEKELNNFQAIQCDFSKREETLALIQRLQNQKLHGIVNCAGIFEGVDFTNFDFSVYERVFEVNVHAPLLLIQGLQQNIENNGSIVNIASTDGMIGSEVGLVYSASKAALINLTMSLANIFAPRNIRVNAIAPGWIGDGMQSPPELLDEARWFNPLHRIGTYDEIASVISFLLSDKANYVNGTTVVADGGDATVNYVLRKESEMKLKK